MNLVYVFIGSGAGGVLRFLLSRFVYGFTGAVYPLGTLTVNLTGCFAIGFFSGLFETFVISPNARSFLFVGLFGGFTTFSTFGIETFNLLVKSGIRSAALNVILNTVLGIILVFAGYSLSRIVLKIIR